MKWLVVSYCSRPSNILNYLGVLLMFKIKLLLAPVLCPVITTDEAYDIGVISKFNDGIYLKGGHAIIVKIV